MVLSRRVQLLSLQCLKSAPRTTRPSTTGPGLVLARRTITTDGTGAPAPAPSSTTTTTTTTTTAESTAVRPGVLTTVGRATATGSYFVVVSAGVALLGVVLWALGSNLFFETRYYSEAVDLIKADPEIKRLLGGDINAYGERSAHRGRRGGGVQSQRTPDGHVFMIFHVEGDTGRYGTCRLDVQEKVDGGSEIRQLYCDIPGTPRIWLKQETQIVKKKRLFSW